MSHRHQVSPFGLALIECACLGVFPLALIGAAWFRFPLLLLPLLVAGIVFALNFPKCQNDLIAKVDQFGNSETAGIPSVFGTQVCLVLSLIASLATPFLIEGEQLQRGFMDAFPFLVLFIFAIAFVHEMLRKNRSDLIHSVATTVAGGLFVSCLCGYIMCWQLFDGVFFGWLSLCLLPYLVVALGYFICALVDRLSGRPMVTSLVKMRVGMFSGILGVLAVNFLTPGFFPTVVINENYIWYALVMVIASVFVSHTHFKQTVTTSNALTRGLFPLIISGAPIYVIATLVQF